MWRLCRTVSMATTSLHPPPNLTALTPVTWTLTQFQPIRGMRKNEKHVLPERGQKWMVTVLQKAKQPVCSESLQQMARKLQYLEAKGCKPYQIMEYPEALLLSDDQIVDRVKKLEEQGVHNISIPLLKMAKGPAGPMARRMNTYLARRKGYQSIADFVKAKLECTEEELMELIGKNPRIISIANIDIMEDKIDTLLEHGASLKDIRRHSFVLKNRTLETIKKRAIELSEMDCNNPLPVKWIMAGENVYEKVVKNYKESLKDHEERNEFFHKVLSKDYGEISPNLPILKQRFRTLKPKIAFLESKGFKLEDIISQRVLQLGLTTIKETYAMLEEEGIEDISMPILYHFVMFKRIRNKPQVRLKLTKIIGIKEDQVTVPPEMMKLLFLQKQQILIENYKFLLDCGFSKESIQRLIIILGHDPKILRRHWSMLEQRAELFPFESWKQDEWKLLNLLQYYIEKEFNFRQPVVLGFDDK